MNTNFNYYNFPKDMTLKYDVKVDLSGLPIKGDSSVSEQDANGVVITVDLNEIKNEYVNFVYTNFNEANSVNPNIYSYYFI